MTADKVIDASVIGAMIFAEPDQNIAQAMLTGAADLYAPLLIDFEVANIALKKIRSQPSESDRIMSLYANYFDFSIAKPDIDFNAAILLAHQEKLSLYDASYLWLALDRNIDLITLDGKLNKAYRRIVS